MDVETRFFSPQSETIVRGATAASLRAMIANCKLRRAEEARPRRELPLMPQRPRCSAGTTP